MKYDFNKCTKEQLVQWAEVSLTDISANYSVRKNNILNSAEVKPRTRAEVDADIAKVIRGYRDRMSFKDPSFNCMKGEEFGELNRLCSEETQG
jgi:hypothetical protein